MFISSPKSSTGKIFSGSIKTLWNLVNVRSIPDFFSYDLPTGIMRKMPGNNNPAIKMSWYIKEPKC